MNLLFKTVLFLRNQSRQLKLTPTDSHVLTILSSHIGNNETTWIKQANLAEECLISKRYLRTILQKLVNKSLIKIDQIISKKGKQHSYSLTEIITNYRSPNSSSVEKTRGTTVPLPPPPRGTGVPLGWGTGVPLPQELSTGSGLVAVDVQDTAPVLKETKESNNYINIKEKASASPPVPLPSCVDEQDWNDFKIARKEMKAPLGKVAEKRALNLLEKLHAAGQNISEVINQSIVNGWKGLFPTRGAVNHGQGQQYQGLNHRQATTQRVWDYYRNDTWSES